MIAYAYVMVGGALGSVARYWLSTVVADWTGPRFPWGTLLINVLGSFVIGWFGALSAEGGRIIGSHEARALVMVGICGGFTTFSSFSLQTLALIEEGQLGWAGFYIAGSVMLCLLSVWAGTELVRG